MEHAETQPINNLNSGVHLVQFKTVYKQKISAPFIQRVDEREQTLTAEIKRWHSETVSAFAERRDQLEAIRKDAEGAFREHKDSVAATTASFRFGIVLKKKLIQLQCIAVSQNIFHMLQDHF